MDPELTKLITGIVSPLAAAAAIVLAATVNAKVRQRRDARDEGPEQDAADGGPPPVGPPAANPPAPTPGGTAADQMREWTEYIPRLIDASVENATRPLLTKIERYEEHERIFARLIQRLYWWDDDNRHGPMPRLTFDEQRKMGLDLLTDHPPSPPAGGERY